MAYSAPLNSRDVTVPGIHFVLFNGVRTRLSQYRRYRQTLNQLMALDSRQLSDLGLNRSMLREVALQAVYEA